MTGAVGLFMEWFKVKGDVVSRAKGQSQVWRRECLVRNASVSTSSRLLSFAASSPARECSALCRSNMTGLPMEPCRASLP